MIKSYELLEWMPLEQWPLVYRFTEERYNKLNSQALATIRPLTAESAVRLAEAHSLSQLAGQAEQNALSDEWNVQTIDP